MKAHVRVEESLQNIEALANSETTLSGYCDALLSFFDKQVESINEKGVLSDQEQLLFDSFFTAFIDASANISSMKATSLSDVRYKISIWRKLAPDTNDTQTPDEVILQSILEDIERLSNSTVC